MSDFQPLNVFVMGRLEIVSLSSNDLNISVFNASLIANLFSALQNSKHHDIHAVYVPNNFLYKIFGRILCNLIHAKLFVGWKWPEVLPFFLNSSLINYIPVRYHPQVLDNSIYVNSSPQIGWGKDLIEASIKGQVIVSVPVPQLEMMLQNNLTCIIVDNEMQIPDKITYLKSHPEEVYRLAKNGQMWLKQNLTSNLLPKIFANEIRKVVQSP